MHLICDGINPQYTATRIHSVERVNFQIDENLLKLVGVAVNHQWPGAMSLNHFDAAAHCFRLKQLNGAVSDRPDVRRDANRCTASPDVKQYLYHSSNLVNLRDDNLKIFCYLRLFEFAAQQHFGASPDYTERGADLMRKARGKSCNGGELVCVQYTALELQLALASLKQTTARPGDLFIDAPELFGD